MSQDINTNLEQIANATYGYQVREAIHDGIAICYSDVESARTIAAQNNEAVTTAMNTWNSLISEHGSITNYLQQMNEYSEIWSNYETFYDQMSVSLHDCQDEITYLQTTIAGKVDAFNTLQTQVTNALTNINDINSAVQATYNDVLNDHAALQELITQTTAAKDAAQSWATSAQNIVDYYNNTLSDEISDAVADANSAATLANLNAQNAAINAAEAHTWYTNAQQATNAANGKITEINNRLEELSDVLAAIEVSRNASDNAVTQVTANLQTVNNLIESVNQLSGEVNTYVDTFDQLIMTLQQNSSAATSAATTANNAASAATAKIAEMDALKSDINDTINSANNAASNADIKASQAEYQASQAQSMASRAETAADACTTVKNETSVVKTAADTAASRANTAAATIEDMTVTSESIGSTGTAEAIISVVDGHKNIHFKLKQGDPGASFLIKGSAYATVSALEEAITNPAVGDQYNVGSSAPYNVYRWTGSSWEDQGQFGDTIDAITTSDIDTIYLGESISGGSAKYLNASSLGYMVNTKMAAQLANKVNAVSGKGLSTNDFTTAYKDKIDSHDSSITTLTSDSSTHATQIEANAAAILAKVSTSDIVNALTSDASNVPLAAAQGKALKTLVDGKADASHSHDDLYYTKSVVDGYLATKLTSADILNVLNSTATNKALSAAQGKALNDSITSLNSNKSNVGHTHDDRYYTESEMDTMLSTKSASNHTHGLSTSALTGTLPVNKGGTGVTSISALKDAIEFGSSTQNARFYSDTNNENQLYALAATVENSGNTTYNGKRVIFIVRNTGLTVFNNTTPTNTIWSLDFPIPIGKGGTNATTAAQARTNLGAAAADHNHDSRYYLKSEVDTKSEVNTKITSNVYNALNSDSTTRALSAAQGKSLKSLVDGKVSKSGDTLSGTLILSDGVFKRKISNFFNQTNTTDYNPIATGIDQDGYDRAGIHVYRNNNASNYGVLAFARKNINSVDTNVYIGSVWNGSTPTYMISHPQAFRQVSGSIAYKHYIASEVSNSNFSCVINVASNSRFILYICGGSKNRHGEFIVSVASNGAISKSEVYKGSDLTLTTANNKITITATATFYVMLLNMVAPYAAVATS